MLQSSPKRSKVHKRIHKSSGCGLFLSNWWQVLSCVFRSNRLKCRQFVFHKYSLSAAPENHCTLYPSRSQMDTFVVCLQGIYSLCFHVINECRKIEFRRCMCYEKWIHIPWIHIPTSLWHAMIWYIKLSIYRQGGCGKSYLGVPDTGREPKRLTQCPINQWMGRGVSGDKLGWKITKRRARKYFRSSCNYCC